MILSQESVSKHSSVSRFSCRAPVTFFQVLWLDRARLGMRLFPLRVFFSSFLGNLLCWFVLAVSILVMSFLL